MPEREEPAMTTDFSSAVPSAPSVPAAGSLTVPLYRLAHSRTGDKGNRSNISVIAWHPALWEVLTAQVTEAAVARQFVLRRPSRVARYLLPNLHAMNFVIDDVLDGGVNDALNLDSHGKALSFLLLDLPVEVPAALAEHLAGPRHG
ncbi:hypothetical protein SAMN05192589_11226 [Paracidovorax valerianellae]|uniref:AtuA-like ferredoxin-fold domain-containing protein n=2 Tax=Paracidovorax valerianellae TaxID=187868 RepID=A0A1G7A0F2_9BURK|nr:hypothetical protein SAMN05192589_11226 [Paracidovorax valerianellae]